MRCIQQGKGGGLTWRGSLDEAAVTSTLLLLQFSVFLFLLVDSCYFAVALVVCVKLICSGPCCPRSSEILRPVLAFW